MDEQRVFTVSQVNGYIKKLMDANRYLCGILVKGEISNFKLHTSGHMYMSLKDDGGAIRAVMFKGAGGGLKFKPENGLKVIAAGRVSVYERDGSYQLYIESMILDGVGDLHTRFEQLKQKLSEEGLFDPRHKKPLPKFPRRIGVVTAPTGAAVRDIINVLGRRFPMADVVLYPVLVQGEAAAGSIAAAVEYFNAQCTMHNAQLVDVLIVGRGGGSIEDLWAFNEEIVARSIFASQIPVVSAVGHEIDFTIADFAADVRAPTPSAAAELVVPSREELYKYLTGMHGRLKRCMRLDGHRQYLDNLYKHLVNAVGNVLSTKKQALAVNASKLEALSPFAVMTRGYAVARTAAGAAVRSVADVAVGDEIEVLVRDGRIGARVELITNSE